MNPIYTLPFSIVRSENLSHLTVDLYMYRSSKAAVGALYLLGCFCARSRFSRNNGIGHGGSPFTALGKTSTYSDRLLFRILNSWWIGMPRKSVKIINFKAPIGGNE